MSNENNLKAQDPVTVLEVAKTLESALVADAPYSITTITKDGESTAEISREEFLEFYSNWAMETIYNVVDDEGNDKLKDVAHELDLDSMLERAEVTVGILRVVHAIHEIKDYKKEDAAHELIKVLNDMGYLGDPLEIKK